MPRVHHRKARKDHKATSGPDILKGEKYFTWSIKTGPVSGQTFKQKTRPLQSQLTNSPFTKGLLQIQERISALSSIDSDCLSEIVDSIRDLANEVQDNLSNMPDSLQEGDTGQMMQERIDSCEAWADEVEGLDIEDEDSFDGEDYEEYIEGLVEELQGMECGL